MRHNARRLTDADRADANVAVIIDSMLKRKRIEIKVTTDNGRMRVVDVINGILMEDGSGYSFILQFASGGKGYYNARRDPVKFVPNPVVEWLSL